MYPRQQKEQKLHQEWKAKFSTIFEKELLFTEPHFKTQIEYKYNAQNMIKILRFFLSKI
jgi:hypothetical protein